jgi:hypothetical protein
LTCGGLSTARPTNTGITARSPARGILQIACRSAELGEALEPARLLAAAALAPPDLEPVAPVVAVLAPVVPERVVRVVVVRAQARLAPVRELAASRVFGHQRCRRGL